MRERTIRVPDNRIERALNELYQLMREITVKNDRGTVMLRDLPETDPEVKDQVWNDNGTLKLSEG